MFEIWEWDKNSSDDYLASGKINMQSALAYEGKPFALEMMRKEASTLFYKRRFREVIFKSRINQDAKNCSR